MIQLYPLTNIITIFSQVYVESMYVSDYSPQPCFSSPGNPYDYHPYLSRHAWCYPSTFASVFISFSFLAHNTKNPYYNNTSTVHTLLLHPLLSILPYNQNLLFSTRFDFYSTVMVHLIVITLIDSFLVLSNVVTPCIHLNISISAASFFLAFHHFMSHLVLLQSCILSP